MIIIEGANQLKEENDYIINAINSTTAGQYCVIVPKNATGTYNMLIDLHQKKSFDEVTAGTKTKDDFTAELSNEYLEVKKQYNNGLLIFPMLNEEEFKTTIDQLDKQKMFDETKKIGAITSELYNNLTKSGVEKQNIDQKIMIINKKEEDEKFVNWLKEQMPGFVESVSLSKEEVKTPTPEQPINNDIFGIPSQPEQPTQTPTGGIFDNIPTPTATEEPKVEQTQPEQPAPTAPEIPNANVDIFGIPNDQPAAPVPEIKLPTEPATPVQAAPVEQEEGPKPVESQKLEGTTTFSPIPNTPEQTTVQPTPTTPEKQEPEKKNGGFVNLAIIGVILVIVTIISIELGKFLYSVYGA